MSKSKAAAKAETETTSKPSADERAAKAQAAKDQHKAEAAKLVREHLSTINANVGKLLDAAEAGKTDAKAFGLVKEAVAEFKTAINKLGVHVAPQERPSKD
jgi:phosphoenolpyruvate-protein kinase (PTS system EI component)